jgi:hypothetical protein
MKFLSTKFHCVRLDVARADCHVRKADLEKPEGPADAAVNARSRTGQEHRAALAVCRARSNTMMAPPVAKPAYETVEHR